MVSTGRTRSRVPTTVIDECDGTGCLGDGLCITTVDGNLEENQVTDEVLNHILVIANETSTTRDTGEFVSFYNQLVNR